MRALHSCNWVIGGPRGAARLLGLERTTLQARMQKLGIPPLRASGPGALAMPLLRSQPNGQTGSTP
jgi:formate hydrogenlyase transcriptional activator